LFVTVESAGDVAVVAVGGDTLAGLLGDGVGKCADGGGGSEENLGVAAAGTFGGAGAGAGAGAGDVVVCVGVGVDTGEEIGDGVDDSEARTGGGLTVFAVLAGLGASNGSMGGIGVGRDLRCCVAVGLVGEVGPEGSCGCKI
jgi:hypothetical protein